MIKLLRYTLVATLLANSACSWFPSFHSVTPEQKSTVVGVAADYVMKVAKVDERALGAMILWNDYLDNSSGARTRQSVFTEMNELKARFPLDKDHPLLLLKVEDVDVSGDDAEVTFRKAGVDNAPKLWVKMIWAGSGWLVTDDSILGSNGAVANILNPSKG